MYKPDEEEIVQAPEEAEPAPETETTEALPIETPPEEAEEEPVAEETE